MVGRCFIWQCIIKKSGVYIQTHWRKAHLYIQIQTLAHFVPRVTSMVCGGALFYTAMYNLKKRCLYTNLLAIEVAGWRRGGRGAVLLNQKCLSLNPTLFLYRFICVRTNYFLHSNIESSTCKYRDHGPLTIVLILGRDKRRGSVQ